MPGQNQATISHNIREMLKAGHPHAQAVAAALQNARKHLATGGLSGAIPDVVRDKFHVSGLFHGPTAGRADKVPVSVPAKSYVIPADVVSGIGQGNTMAGSKVLDNMFGTPYGVKGHGAKGIGMPKPPHISKGLAAGGSTGHGFVPIMVSDGEYLVHPEAITRIGKGDIDHGHKVLDYFVVKARKKIADKMKSLPGPKGSKKK